MKNHEHSLNSLWQTVKNSALLDGDVGETNTKSSSWTSFDMGLWWYILITASVEQLIPVFTPSVIWVARCYLPFHIRLTFNLNYLSFLLGSCLYSSCSCPIKCPPGLHDQYFLQARFCLAANSLRQYNHLASIICFMDYTLQICLLWSDGALRHCLVASDTFHCLLMSFASRSRPTNFASPPWVCTHILRF